MNKKTGSKPGDNASGLKIAGYRVHPAASALPMMSAEEHVELVEDIRENGQRVDALVTKDGLLLDGRNRGLACDELGIELLTETYDGDDPVGWVESTNLKRRNLSPSQRAWAAAKFAALRKGSNQYKTSSKVDRPRGLSTQSEAAGRAGSSERSVRRARVVEEKAIPELHNAVRDGVVELKPAEKIAKLPKPKQAQALDRISAGEKASAVLRDLAPTSTRRAATPRKKKQAPSKWVEGYEKAGELAEEIQAILREAERMRGRLERELEKASQAMPPRGKAEIQDRVALTGIRSAIDGLDRLLFTNVCDCVDAFKCKKCSGTTLITQGMKAIRERIESRGSATVSAQSR